MARTRVWATEEANYTDSTLATSIDNKGTELRADVREILNQLIGVAESTVLPDPFVGTNISSAKFTATATVALAFSAANAKIIPGITTLNFRDSADGATNLSIADAGAIVVRSTISGATTISANIFAGAAASSKILIGATNLLIRDSADTTTYATFSSGGLSMATAVGFSAGGMIMSSSQSQIVNVTANILLNGGQVLATNTTVGFPVFPTMAGTPTGNAGGAGAHVLDTTGSKVWWNMGGTTWKGVAIA